MVTVQIGKLFLRAYNKRHNLNLTAEEFFTTIYFSLFFNHRYYMQWVTNSPFTQGKKPPISDPKDRMSNLNDLINKIDKGDRDASVYIGGASSDAKAFQITSGNVSSMNVDISNEDVYYSWIGSGLGVGVKGGLSIFFFNEDILMDIYEGWIHYRNCIEDYYIDPNKINSWNGQWLNYLYSYNYQDYFDFNLYKENEFFKDSSINTIPFSNLYFNISRNIVLPEICMYVYSFGQMNTTLGFYNLVLSDARRFIENYTSLYDKYDANESLFNNNLYSMCQLGVIDMRAFKPVGIESIDKINLDESKDSYQDNLIKYKTFKAWKMSWK